MPEFPIFLVPRRFEGDRLDRVLPKILVASREPGLAQAKALWVDLSRASWQHKLARQEVLVNGKPAAIDQKVRAGDRLTVLPNKKALPKALKSPSPYQILSKTPAFLAVNKGPALSVHPVSGHSHSEMTLIEALSQTYPELAKLSEMRNGLIHRLDRDTSGILLVARKAQAVVELKKLFQSRKIEKRYLALVFGEMPVKGVLEDALVRKKGSLKRKIAKKPEEEPQSRLARLSYERLAWSQKDNVSLVLVSLETGRTHQIRVQMAAFGHPVLGDHLYASKPSRDLSRALGTPRQMLHAASLRFSLGARDYALQAPLPADFQAQIERFPAGFKRATETFFSKASPSSSSEPKRAVSS
ncbi:MAG: RluA family pseudouridine synthase [Candidatus Moraniibacteriota bacterium]